MVFRASAVLRRMSADRADALLATLHDRRGASASLEKTVAAAKVAGERAHMVLQNAVARLDAQLQNARDVADSIADGFESDSSDCERSAPTDVEAKSNFQGPGISLLSEGAARPELAIAMLIRDPPLASLHSFVRYHQHIGFSRIYLFFDDVNDDYSEQDHLLMRAASSYKGLVSVNHCTNSWFQRLQHSVSSATWDRYGEYISTDLIARQVLAVEQAILMGCSDGLDWVLHIDIDEMFHWSDAATAISKDLAASWFALVPDHVDAVRFLNMEAVPERTELDGANGETGSGDYFREVNLFKVNPSTLGTQFHSLIRRHWPRGRPYFTAYKNGKTAVRCQRTVVPKGSHGFERCDPNRLLVSVDAAQFVGDAAVPHILHFPHASFTLWWRKYTVLGRFPGVWCGQQVIPKDSFHIQSRDVVHDSLVEGIRSGKALEFYDSTMVFKDELVTSKLLQCGLLVRYTNVAECLSSLFV